MGKSKSFIYHLILFFSAFVWFVNGFFCKVLMLEPRHMEIVSNILGDSYAFEITIAIGLAEILFACWISFGKFSKATVFFQIILIMTMNIIEFNHATDLLLWGKLNLLFATAFCSLILINEFIFNKQNNFMLC